MAKVKPFQGNFFNLTKTNPLDRLITPPYDVIPKDQEGKYLARSNWNFGHLILPTKDKTDYQKRKELLDSWLSKGETQQDSEARYYLYRQSFNVGGKPYRRDTLMCAVQLTPFHTGDIRPHELVHSKYRDDRLEVLKATRTNLSHVFGMVRDPENFLEKLAQKVTQSPPFLECTDDEKVTQQVFAIKATPEITQFFESRSIYIIDGHHRFGSALQFATDTGTLGTEKPEAYVLFAIASSNSPSLVIFPTHRMVKKPAASIELSILERSFNVESIDERSLRNFVETVQPNADFVIGFQDHLYRLSPIRKGDWGPALNQIPVTWSDEVVLKEILEISEDNRSYQIEYERDFERAWRLRNEFACTLYHSPPKVEQVLSVADEKKVMPQKSTYFYPKLAVGLIWRPF